VKYHWLIVVQGAGVTATTQRPRSRHGRSRRSAAGWGRSQHRGLSQV